MVLGEELGNEVEDFKNLLRNEEELGIERSLGFEEEVVVGNEVPWVTREDLLGNEALWSVVLVGEVLGNAESLGLWEELLGIEFVLVLKGNKLENDLLLLLLLLLVVKEGLLFE